MHLQRRRGEDGFVEYYLEAQYPPFTDYGLLIGEAAYQLRSAMDQVVFALSVLPTGSDEQQRKAAQVPSFPVLLRRSDKDIRSRLRYVPNETSAEVFREIDEVQPYRDGAPINHPLAVLNELNIRDKHRVLEPAGSALTIKTAGLDPRVQLRQESLQHGSLIARVPIDIDDATNLGTRVTNEIRIPMERYPTGLPMQSLGVMFSFVAFEVLPRFRPFFEPLPPTVRWPTPDAGARPTSKARGTHSQ